MALELMGGILVVLVLLNTWTTRSVLRDDLSPQGQRASQIAFVWLVPFLGALLTLHLKRKETESSTGRYREEPDPGDDFGYSRPRHHMTEEAAEAEGSGSADGGSSGD